MLPLHFPPVEALKPRGSIAPGFLIRWLAVLLLPLAARAVDTTTVFNEVMYHPAGADDPEWIELHNEMAVNMDLSGWRITGGVNFTFPAGTTIAAGGYMVVASNPAALQASAGITGVLGPWTGSLDNGSEMITLRNAIDREMDEFHYEDSGCFPVAPDGSGVSLAKRAPQLATGDPESWNFSGKIGGTPGAENFPTGPIYGPTTTVAAFGDAWNFNQTGREPRRRVGANDLPHGQRRLAVRAGSVRV